LKAGDFDLGHFGCVSGMWFWDKGGIRRLESLVVKLISPVELPESLYIELFPVHPSDRQDTSTKSSQPWSTIFYSSTMTHNQRTFTTPPTSTM